ncbi:MAG TPA: hypothetical protein VHV08_04960 [Pirellulales bacterium]|jgi:hypothetical protein|nr:hypothetical protein [Pirellulales bacterium]
MSQVENKPRQRLAIVATVWRYESHAQHMGDRFLVGYPWNGRWHRPEMDVVALYVDQRPPGDQSEARAREFGFQVYPTIAETLRCGGDRLAVDGVLIIGEHGDYPVNAKGQIQYPRYEFFQQVVDVFERDGRSVPVFNDKHLSYSFEKARDMVAASERLGFALLAGSSLPVTWRLPPVDLPLDAIVDEALMVGCGSSDPMDFHALEAMQCMLERRKNGETGVKAVQLIQGPAVWQAGHDGRWSPRLLEAALARSTSRCGQALADGRTQDLAHNGQLEVLVRDPAAYLIEYNDGLRATLLMLNGGVTDYTFACRLKSHGEIISTQFLLPVLPNVAYSTCLMNKVEQMIASGKAPYRVARTELTSGILDRCLESKIRGNQRIATPELAICYRAPRESQYCGASTG